jgi:hypothetical protein
VVIEDSFSVAALRRGIATKNIFYDKSVKSNKAVSGNKVVNSAKTGTVTKP